MTNELQTHKKPQSLIEVSWYENLLDDLQKIEYTGVVLTRWIQGGRITQEENKFNNAEYGSKRIENLAKDLKMSPGEVWTSIRFYKKYPITNFDGIKQSYRPELPNKSWFYITHTLLPKNKRGAKKPIILPPGKYNIIYADPPWEYYEGGYKNQSQHYDTYTVEELKQMPLDDIAADNCILFLWVTFPILDQVFDLIKWWEFSYSTVGFVWVKSTKNDKFFFGLGNWTRSNAELCLIATKGSIERKDASISQILYEPIGEHSAKPTVVREKIVKLVGDLPRIELFARTKTEGWDIMGDQIQENQL